MPGRPAPFPTAAAFMPAEHSLPVLREAAAGCQGCDLYKRGTQTVFGEGPPASPAMLVGEQPGDYEDRSGRPFIGPAGRLLDEGLHQAGIDRSEVYVTNAVKHFKWEERGKRRIHAKPSSREIEACKPWLLAELEAVKPQVVICLGSTAAQSLLGPDFRVTRERGQLLKTQYAPWLLATVHPSSLLRIPSESARHAAFEQFVDDLRVAASELHHAH